MSKRYNNYHKHDHMSSILTPDSNTKCIEYINRAIELGHTNYFTTNHGTGGDIFESNTLCKKNNINCKFGIEGYIVPDPKEKDARNYHIILIPTTNVARKKLNLASSRASEEGYYYKPRFFIDDLLNNFNDNELIVTTACLGGILRDKDSINQIFKPLYEKYNKNIFLEVQPHNIDEQKTLNELCVKYSNDLNLQLIAANDSHYIYPEEAADRNELLKGKGMGKNAESDMILDYPSYDEFAERFKKQGILTIEQINKAIENTLVFDSCENIVINDNVKMPSIYPPGTPDEVKIHDLTHIICSRFPEMCDKDGIPEEDRDRYRKEIAKEMSVIKETSAVHSADYFLLNYKLMHLAIDKYGGILTRSGRGSGGSFLINKVLGITEIDRLSIDLPIYSERFMSTARLLENKAMPDIDYNVVEQEPFVKASRELLGHNGCYPMVAYGTMKETEAFRNVCRSNGLEFAEYNDVAKDIDKYRDDPKWKPLIDKAQDFVGTIVSSSPHPCAHVLSNDDIRSEIGLLRIGDKDKKKGVLCALITSSEADEYRYLKNDYLVVTVWGIISNVFEKIGKPIMSVKELLNVLDDGVWKLFEDGITATLNQVDGSWATELVKTYKPQSIEELAQFVACIRPSFNSFRDKFIHRQSYSTGSEKFDNILSSTNHFVLFQENLMQYFEWLGITPAESIGLIKKISKKKIKQSDFDDLTERLRDGWIKQTGSIDQFEETWSDMQSMMNYGFNTPHGTAYALDCLYCAYLKQHYPLVYYTTVLNMYDSDQDKTDKLTKELDYFGIKISAIKFRRSQSEYTYNKDDNTIYKGMKSIKYLNKKLSRELYALRDREFEDFYDLLVTIKNETSVDSRQLEILIKLNFFSEFGNPNQLLYQSELFNNYYSRKQFNKKDLNTDEIAALMMCDYIETDNLYKVINSLEFIRQLDNSSDIKTSIRDYINYENEHLGYISITVPTLSEDFAYVTNVNSKYKNRIVSLYRLKTGETETVKVRAKTFEMRPIEAGQVIKTIEVSEEKKWKKKPDGGFERIDEYENILKKWSEVK